MMQPNPSRFLVSGSSEVAVAAGRVLLRSQPHHANARWIASGLGEGMMFSIRCSSISPKSLNEYTKMPAYDDGGGDVGPEEVNTTEGRVVPFMVQMHTR